MQRLYRRLRGIPHLRLVFVLVIVLALILFEAGRLVWAQSTVANAAQKAIRYAVTGQYNQDKYTVACSPCSSDDVFWAGTKALRLASIRDVVSEQVRSLPTDPISGATTSEALKISVCSQHSGFSYDEIRGACTPYDDPGGPGDFVSVHIHYNYPVGSFLGGPISVVPIEASANGINESYRTAKVINIADLGTGGSSTDSTAIPVFSQGASADQVSTNRKIVMNAALSLQVADIDESIAQVTQIAQQAGGYVASSESSEQGSGRSGKIQIRIPADQFQDALTSVRKLAKTILRDSVTGEDVTAQYVDLQSRLTGLQATLQRTQELLAKAQNVDEALKVSTQIGTLEQQIEQITGQLKYLSNRIDFSTISADLGTVQTAPPVAEAWLPGTTVERAIAFLGALGRLAVDILIWVIIIGLPLGLIVLVGTRIYRWQRRQKKPADENAA